jgi:glucose uptake protein GlcU
MAVAAGLIFAGIAAVCYGCQYIPVKKHEIYDGTTFQWFMCNGILMVGFLTAVFTHNLTIALDPLVLLGGAFWALANYLVMFCVKLLGLGLGFSLTNFVNLIVSYLVGRFGLVGIPRMGGHLLWCDLGCVLILVSFITMLLVGEDNKQPKTEGQPTTNASYRLEQYKSWRKDVAAGEAGLPKRPGQKNSQESEAIGQGRLRARSFVHRAAGIMTDMSVSQRGPQHHSVGGFSMHTKPEVQFDPDLGPLPDEAGPPQENTPLIAQGGTPGKGVTHDAKPASPAFRKFGGVMLAIGAGCLMGMQSVPATLYSHAHPEVPAAAVVFPETIGIWVASSCITLVYSSFAHLQGWPLHHSMILPASFSGVIWSLGFLFMMAGIRELGFGVCYTLDAVGPILVASLLSVFVFKEISGTRQLCIFFASFVLQAIGVTLIATMGSEGGHQSMRLAYHQKTALARAFR